MYPSLAKSHPPASSRRIATIIAIDVLDVLLLARNRRPKSIPELSKTAEEKEGERRREESRGQERGENWMHRACTFNRCTPHKLHALGHDAEILESSRRASEAHRNLHRVHTTVFPPRYARRAMRNANDLFAVITKISRYGIPNTLITREAIRRKRSKQKSKKQIVHSKV